ncbi:MAG: alpha/beta fold hydrolase [Actinomycetota bacterium]|nr:alpha/beta fold hydrolase [Actinomycetota bacterium]
MTELTKQATDKFIEVKGIRLHYNDAGSGPVLLGTHGGGPGASAWGGLGKAVPALAEHFRVLLLDLPNFGESQKHVKNPRPHPDVFLAGLVGDLLDALGIDQPISYYSSSGGGPAALRFALDHPGRTHKLVLQAYAPGMAQRPDSLARRTTQAFTANPSRQAMAKLFELFVPNAERRSEDAIDDRWQAASAPGHLESRAEFATLAANSDITEKLPTLAAEALVIWGANDLIVPVERALKSLESIPRARCHIWGDGTGHLVPYEHPEDFARVVRQFLTH